MNLAVSYCLEGGSFRFVTPNVFALFLLICHKELLLQNAPEDNKIRGGDTLKLQAMNLPY